jgi:GrpB-like predicted nucleotidyltransferase (UPF0157 family)
MSFLGESEMINIVPYRPAWRDEFLVIGRTLRRALGDLALRIDHIGSTSVPGLAAKDIIDVQITVARLEPAVERALTAAGYQRRIGFTQDHIPPGGTISDADWVKWLFKPPAAQRLANIHVRLAGRPNQRYALLFRDYLRAHPAAAQAYAQVKDALANNHANDVDAYYAVKDPVCDIIIAGAEEWALRVGWAPEVTDC